MKIFESQNDELILGHVTLFRESFREGQTEHRQSVLGHHPNQCPSPQNSIDGSVKALLGCSHRLFVGYRLHVMQRKALPVKA
jgi:hypothetical protein